MYDIKAVKIHNLWNIETPFYFSDGDPVLLYLEQDYYSNYKITDKGHTLMHLSYVIDEKIIERNAQRMAKHDKSKVYYENGELCIDNVTFNTLHDHVVRFYSFIDELSNKSLFIDQN